MEQQVKSVIRVSFIIFIFFVCSSFNINKCDKNPDLGEFEKYFMRSYQLPSSVMQDCKWNYAFIVLRTSSENKIIKVDFANSGEISNEFQNSFQFLKGYQFPKTIKIHQRPILLILTVEQLGGMGCDKPERNYSPSIVSQKILTDIDEYLKREPSTIIKYNPIVKVVGGRVN